MSCNFSEIRRHKISSRLLKNPLSLREVRRRCRECPVDIRAAERVRMIFAHPGGNTGVRVFILH
jgi:hypothetical protein